MSTKLVPRVSRKAAARMAEFAGAQVANALKGGGDPADIPEIEARLTRARAKLVEYIAELEAFRADGERAMREGDWS